MAYQEYAELQTSLEKATSSEVSLLNWLEDFIESLEEEMDSNTASYQHQDYQNLFNQFYLQYTKLTTAPLNDETLQALQTLDIHLPTGVWHTLSQVYHTVSNLFFWGEDKEGHPTEENNKQEEQSTSSFATIPNAISTQKAPIYKQQLTKPVFDFVSGYWHKNKLNLYASEELDENPLPCAIHALDTLVPYGMGPEQTENFRKTNFAVRTLATEVQQVAQRLNDIFSKDEPPNKDINEDIKKLYQDIQKSQDELDKIFNTPYFIEGQGYGGNTSHQLLYYTIVLLRSLLNVFTYIFTLGFINQKNHLSESLLNRPFVFEKPFSELEKNAIDDASSALEKTMSVLDQNKAHLEAVMRVLRIDYDEEEVGDKTNENPSP